MSFYLTTNLKFGFFQNLFLLTSLPYKTEHAIGPTARRLSLKHTILTHWFTSL